MISNSTDLTAIGARVKKLREEQNLTQSQLAEKLNVKRENVNYWENGKRDIKTEHIVHLAEQLNTSCDYILRGIKTENINIMEATGLNDTSIEILKSTLDISVRYDDFANLNKALNGFIDTDSFVPFLLTFGQFLDFAEEFKEEFKEGYAPYKKLEFPTKEEIARRFDVIQRYGETGDLLAYRLQKHIDNIVKEYLGEDNGNSTKA